MKPRHAAALTLLGWYLMAPPITDWVSVQAIQKETDHDIEVCKAQGLDWGNPGSAMRRMFLNCVANQPLHAPTHMAPLSDWETIAVFDSANLCQKAWTDLRREHDTRPDQPAQNYDTFSARLAQCVSTDDPRLKAK